jgi:hypothetical protein
LESTITAIIARTGAANKRQDKGLETTEVMIGAYVYALAHGARRASRQV